jgi:hypothetical protein
MGLAWEAEEGWGECVVEELGAMTARNSAAAWFFFCRDQESGVLLKVR